MKKTIAKSLPWGFVFISVMFMGAFMYMAWSIGQMERDVSVMAQSLRWVVQAQQMNPSEKIEDFSGITLDRIAVRFGTKAEIKETCGDKAGACWTGKTDGWHFIWLPHPTGPNDKKFACFFYHELLHAELGRWHNGNPNSSCHDGEYNG